MTPTPEQNAKRVFLKPCPFCGGIADLIPAHGAFAHEVGCAPCNIWITTTHPTPEPAIEAWNRRRVDDRIEHYLGEIERAHNCEGNGCMVCHILQGIELRTIHLT